ncbi:MAG TPA: CopG family transcriptional regulator [Acidimicrobiales bacterium]|nr:CopG family transcriptional regulator [Acidimicrobiales bacterium]
MNAQIHGHTASGIPIDDAMVERLADEAEAGFDVQRLVERRGRRGRPALGEGPSTVESVRLDPDLKQQLAARARQDDVSVSDVIREALRRHLAQP